VENVTACLGQVRRFPLLYVFRGIARSDLADQAREKKAAARAAFEFGAAEADFEEALRLNRQARNERERKATAYAILVNRALLRFRGKKYDDAVVDSQEAIGLDPKPFQAYVNLAQAYAKLGRWDDAEKELSRAIQKRGDLAALYRERAGHCIEREHRAVLARQSDEVKRAQALALPDLE
jgi:tetratricopeptide (TPR) repeat protein